MRYAQPPGLDGMKLGGDPELYAVTKDGQAISSHLVMRRHPSPRYRSMRNPILKRDGAALELELSPRYCRDELNSEFFTGLLEALYRTRKIGKDCGLSTAPVQQLDGSRLENAPQDIFQFGCKPDWNAYTGVPQRPVCDRFSLERYTGGHLHMEVSFVTEQEAIDDFPLGQGWFADEELKRRWTPAGTIIGAAATDKLEAFALLARLSDFFVALPLVAVLGTHHSVGEAQRRLLYGKAGSFRMPKHGFEYRVLSSNAVMLSPVLMYLTYGLFRSVFSVIWHPFRAERWISDSSVYGNGYYSYRKPNMTTVDMLRRHVKMLEDKIAPATTVRECIDFHDVPTAETLTNKLFQFLATTPKKDRLDTDQHIADTVSVLIEGNHRDMAFTADPVYNWGLQADSVTDQGSWNAHPWNGRGGICAALRGRFDEHFVPQRPVYEELAKANSTKFDRVPLWLHPFPRYDV